MADSEAHISMSSQNWKHFFPDTLVPVTFTNTEMAADPKEMVKKWQNGHGVNLTLSASNVEMLPCHREVLEKLGESMKKVLQEREDELNARKVAMKDMDATFVNALIKYCYTGKITLTTETVLNIYDGSIKCDIPYLQARCVDFIIDNIKRVNYLALYVLADEKGWIKLKEAMWKHCMSHFSDIIQNPEFLNLPPGALLEMLRSERLLVGDINNVPPPCEQEKRIWEAIKSYVDRDPDDRAGYLIGFLQHVRSV